MHWGRRTEFTFIQNPSKRRRNRQSPRRLFGVIRKTARRPRTNSPDRIGHPEYENYKNNRGILDENDPDVNTSVGSSTALAGFPNPGGFDNAFGGTASINRIA